MQDELTYIHPNLKLLSNSSSVLLHKCPRKYELYKLLPKAQDEDDDDTGGHLNFGSVVGIGVQKYFETGNIDNAIFSVFMAWKKILDDDAGERSKKTFWHVLYALDKFIQFRKTELSVYELAFVNGKPAIELGFSIDLGDGFFYRGFLDALLINKIKLELAVFEGKTTRNKVVHEAMYKHSGQALGYSLILDAVSKLILDRTLGSSFKTAYCIYKTSSYEWEKLEFNKTFTHRAMWIKNILLDKQKVIDYASDNYFPMQGENCFDFFRACPHFGTCELSNSVMVGDYKLIPLIKEDEDKYPFKFHINEIIEAQFKMHEEA